MVSAQLGGCLGVGSETLSIFLALIKMLKILLHRVWSVQHIGQREITRCRGGSNSAQGDHAPSSICQACKPKGLA